MSDRTPIVLTIAGFDPSSGAGVTADVKTAAAHGCFAAACITALTVQSTSGVRSVHPVDATVVKATLEELASDLKIGAVHLGMLGNGKVAEVVAEFLESAKLPLIVVDPIIQASSGAELLDAGGVEVLKQRILPMATVATPNLAEAGILVGKPVGDLEGMKSAAEALCRMRVKNAVVTGGHLDGEAVDVLGMTACGAKFRALEFRGPKLESKSTHGTGCAFSMSVACSLASGFGVEEAVKRAKAYVTAAIKNAYPLGKSTGPVNHLFK